MKRDLDEEKLAHKRMQQVACDISKLFEKTMPEPHSAIGGIGMFMEVIVKHLFPDAFARRLIVKRFCEALTKGTK